MTGLVLFLLFTGIPALETWGIIEIGKIFGGWETALYLVFMGMLGAWLGKRAGFAVLRDVFAGLARREPPADRLVEVGLVLVGAVLLITPGVLTDIVGILLFIAPVRRWLAPRVKVRVLNWLTRRGMKVGTAGAGPRMREQQKVESAGFEHPVQD